MIEIKRVPKATGGGQKLKSNFVAVRNSKQGRGADSDHKSGKSGRGSNSASTRDLKQGRGEMSDSMTNETGIDDVIFDESEVEAFRAARLAGDGLRHLVGVRGVSTTSWPPLSDWPSDDSYFSQSASTS
jgi:hypothetical protein